MSNETLERSAFSISEFCYRNSMSHSTFHKLERAKQGPAVMRAGALVRITREAELAWQKARSEPDAVEVAREKARARGVVAGKLAVLSPRHVANVKRAKRSA
jgi:hypothetical protein